MKLNRIERKFIELKQSGSKALITYITAGVPSLRYTLDIVNILSSAGADIIELGVPFSDPIADGPTIQRASEMALKNGVTLQKILNLVRKLRKNSDVPIVLMGYYNPFLSYGIEKFIKEAIDCGVDGVIVPDLPPEEAGLFREGSKSKDISTVFLLAPTSTEERIKLVSRYSSGFIYYVSLTGVTGSRELLPHGIGENVKRIKSWTELPVCVGFGVSNSSQAKMLAKVADGVIVGSAIIKIILEEHNRIRTFKKIRKFTEELKEALS